MTHKKSPSLLLILLSYVVAFAAAVFIVRQSELAEFSPLMAGFAADIVATLVVFAFSMLYRNSSAYDPYWSVAPPLLYLYWASRSGGAGGFRTTLLLAVTLLWAVRLTSNWMRDWPGLGHEDWRYREFREKFGKAFPAVSLGSIHLFPTVIVGIASIPAWKAMGHGGALGIWEILAVLFSGGGALLSFVADEQMRAHRRSGQGGAMTGGLWGISRHPNYLGEIMFWFGLWFFAMGASLSYWWTGVGALAMLLMFLGVSIPWMEKRILGKRPEYQAVIETVPMLIPIPGRNTNAVTSK